MQVAKAGVLYFALVFAVGFVLGAIRTREVVPRVGTRTAELIEMPIMLPVTIVAARWTLLRLSVPIMWSARLEMGCIALALMLIAEFGFVLWIRGLSIETISPHETLCREQPITCCSWCLPSRRCLCRDEHVRAARKSGLRRPFEPPFHNALCANPIQFLAEHADCF